MKQIKGILFDYGGTLDTPGRHWAHVLWKGYREACIPVEENDFRDAYVYGERAMATSPLVRPQDTFRDILNYKITFQTTYLRENGCWICNEALCQRAVEAITAYCDTYARRMTERNSRVLDSLYGHYPMALVTNFYGNISAVLREYGLDRFFCDVIESARVGVRKPDPEIYRLGVEVLSLRPEQVLVVGDSYEKDIRPASVLGCHTAWLKGEGWNPEPPGDRIADVVLADLSELNDYL